MLNGQEKKSQHFAHNLQNTMIMKELKKCFGDIYLEGEQTISTNHFFILENLRINYQMNASEFKGLLYNMLYEEPFPNHRFDMT